MNDKIIGILIKIARQLQSYRWKLGADYDIVLRGEQLLPLSKNIPVSGTFSDEEWNDSVETYLHLSMESDDQITWYPQMQLEGNIHINGANSSKDILHKIPDISIGFAETDINATDKIEAAAKEIDNVIQTFIQEEFVEYLSQNSSAIKSYNKGGWKADDDAYFDR